MKTRYRRFPMLAMLLTLIAVALSACGAPAPGESVTSTSEALTPVTVSMWIAYQTPAPTNGLYAVVNDDAAHPSPLLTTISVFNNHAGLSSLYHSLSHTAIFNLSTTDWNTLVTDMGLGVSAGDWVKVILTYDSSAAGNDKPIVANTGGVPQINLCTGIGLMYGANCG